MARYKQRYTTPPGGWKYLQTESMLVIEGESLGDLVAKVVAHRTHKGYEPKDADSVALEVERFLCTRLGKSYCRPEGPDDNWTPAPETVGLLDLGAVKAASAAAWHWFKSGGALVPIEEAKARADVCAKCPCAQRISGCMSCGVAKIVGKLVPEERRFMDGKGCVICGCSLSAKLNLPAGAIRASEEGRGLTYPVGCWVRTLMDGS